MSPSRQGQSALECHPRGRHSLSGKCQYILNRLRATIPPNTYVPAALHAKEKVEASKAFRKAFKSTKLTEVVLDTAGVTIKGGTKSTITAHFCGRLE